MTVRTRKTITDLIQQLKVQEKEIKSQLSDGQRRLNETRDRIATCYWVIEEIGDVEPCEDYDPCEELTRLSQKEFQELVDANPHLTYEQVEDIITQNGMLMPVPTVMSKEKWEDLIRLNPNISGTGLEKLVANLGFICPDFYEGCPCPDCSWDREKGISKEKPKAKPLPKKKSKYQVVKKGSKYVVEKKPAKKTKKGKK